MKYILTCLAALILLITGVPATTIAAQSACSTNTPSAEINLSVPNVSNQRLNVYWVNFQCQEELKGVLQPNKVFFQTTYAGHVWVFRDRNGNEVQRFTASVGEPTVLVGAPTFQPEAVTSNCSSAGTQENVDLTATNNTDDPVLLFWIGFDCKEELYRLIEAQDWVVEKDVFVGHDWVVRYIDGRVAKHITLSQTEKTIVIDPPPSTVTAVPTTVSSASTGSNPASSTPTVANTPSTTANTVESAPTVETSEASFPVTESGCEVVSVTPDMGFDAFYAKTCDYNGLPILASDLVSDEALEQAWLTAANVLYTRPDVVASLVKMNFRIVIMSIDELTTDVPELAYLSDDKSQDYDVYRGYDKVLEEPRIVATGEENLLCTADDVNPEENLLVQSLGNLTRFALVRDLEPAFGDKLEPIRQNAISQGLWAGDNPITDTNGSYWNFGVKAYFNSAARLSGETDPFTNTRDELATYDPQLYQLIDSVFNSEVWSPVCPTISTAATETPSPTVEPTVENTPVPEATVESAPTVETSEASFPVTESGCEVVSVTPDMGFDAFYAKTCDYNGLPILASDLVSDEALEQAWLTAANVLYTRPDVVASLVKMNFRIVIMSIDELTTDVPELAYLSDDKSQDYDVYRGYDKVLEEPRIVATGEENLLCTADDVNPEENLLVQSLGNLTRFALVRDLEPAFGDKLEPIRQNAISQGLWAGDNPITDTNGSYWNFGVKAYFNSAARLSGETDPFTNTRDELATYDPQLYQLIDSVFNSEVWSPSCPQVN